MTTYTIKNVNGKAGSIVLTPSDAHLMPEYFLNLKAVKLQGSNPFLADNVTLNPLASFSLWCADTKAYLIKDMPMVSVTNIGGSGTPVTLALTLAALGNLIAE